MKKSATKLSRGRKRQAGGAKEARGSIAPPMVRAGKRPKLSETDPERVWEKVNPLMYRVHHGQPSLEEIVSCLAEYDDKSRPLRDFITGWAVQWLGGIKLKQRRNVRGQPRSRPERIRLTLPDILQGLAYMGEATAGALLDDVAIAWLKHDGAYVVDPQMKERLAAYRVRVEAKNVEMARSRGEDV